MENRASLLRQVVRYEQPLTETLALLRAYGWDSEEELVVLARTDAIAILERYLKGELSPQNVEHWAELLELRDDVGYEPAFADELKRLIFLLANPDVNGALSPSLAVRMLRALRTDPE